MRAPLPNTAPAPRRSGPARFAWSRGAAFLGAMALAAVAGTPQAIGLGEVTQQSGLGRPLRIVVPIIAAAGEEISGECFKLAPTQRGGDGIPEVLTARVTLERTAAGARLVVTTLRPVDDPVVKVTLQAGCTAAVRREYTLLLDPLPIDTPVASDAAAVVADAPARTAGRAAPVGVAGEGEARSAPAAPTDIPAPRAQQRRRASAAGATEPPAATRRPAPAAAPAPKPARKAAAAPQPKLTVSTATPAAATPGKGAGDAAAREQQELANALEAETIVLRQRVVELAATVDRMQQEITAAQALQAARLAAEEAAKATPRETIRRWWSDGWPIIAMAIGIALLLAAGLLGMRRRRGMADTPVWMPPVAPDEPPPVRAEPRPAATASGAARAAALAAQARQGPDTRGGPVTAVAVSELSHVTEEAGVYLAFNRVDRAIEVLQQHIHSGGGSLPAAWLMLLDLYRRQGRDKDFRELAQDFHLRFNAALPVWDNFPADNEADRGIEAFPHIVRQLVSSWGTPECRGLLDRLLHDNRDGRRTGFSLPAYEDILFLRQLADHLGADAPAAAAVRRIPRAGASAGPVAGATPPAASKLPMALDLELELDRDMLDSAKVPRPGTPPPKPGKS